LYFSVNQSFSYVKSILPLTALQKSKTLPFDLIPLCMFLDARARTELVQPGFDLTKKT